MRRVLALVLFWTAVLLAVAGGLTTAFGLLGLPLGVWLGAALMTLGLNVLVGGDLIVAPDAKPFSVKAKVSRAVLDIAAELPDVEVRANNDYERLATVRAMAGGGPNLEVVEGVAHLRLAQSSPWIPGAANWQARLATNVLWDVKARSLLGHLNVDLSGIRVDRVALKSLLGGVHVTCPRRGRPRIELETWLGDLVVVVPSEVGARVKVEPGRLAHVNLDSTAFDQLDETTYVTHNVETAQTVAVITLRTQAGEMRVNHL